MSYEDGELDPTRIANKNAIDPSAVSKGTSVFLSFQKSSRKTYSDRAQNHSTSTVFLQVSEASRGSDRWIGLG